MKKVLVKTLALAFVGSLFVVGSAMATPGPFDTTWNDDHYIAPAGSYAGILDISGFFDVGKEHIASALATFTLKEDGEGLEEGWMPYRFGITIGSQLLSSYYEGLGEREIVLEVLSLDDLSLDGMIAYSVTSWDEEFYLGTDFVLDSVQLEGMVASPEPATLFLFGTGIAGLAGFSRKKKKTST